MTFFSFGASKPNTYLVLTLGSSHASATLVRAAAAHEKKPEIIATVSKTNGPTESKTVKEHLGATTNTLSQCITTLMRENPCAITEVYCFLASPWCTATLVPIVYTQNESFVVTERLLHAIQTKEVTQFLSQVNQTYVHDGTSAEFLEQQRTVLYVNGYSTQSPFGKQATLLETNLYIAALPSMVRHAVNELVAHLTHVSRVTFHPFMLAAHTVVRDTLRTVPDFLLLDVGADATELLLVKKGVMVGSGSFPYGKNFLYTKLQSALSIPYDEAVSLLSLYLGNALEEGKRAVLERTLSQLEIEWVRAFQEALENAKHEPGMAPAIVLAGHATVLPWFERALRSEDFHRYTLATDHFTIFSLQEELLSQHIKIPAHYPFGVSALIETLFIRNNLV